MTDKKPKTVDKIDKSHIRGFSGFHIDGEKTNEGLSISVGGIIAINEYSENEITLVSHGGRITLRGRRLKLCVYEDKTVEVRGRIEEIIFGYGKN